MHQNFSLKLINKNKQNKSVMQNPYYVDVIKYRVDLVRQRNGLQSGVHNIAIWNNMIYISKVLLYRVWKHRDTTEPQWLRFQFSLRYGLT